MTFKLKTLIKLRKDNNLSLQNMADLLKISKTFYWQIENGKRNLNYEMAIRIALIFNETPDSIFLNDFIH
ncbi:MAG: helix-turn-helix transcriptional regulator [Firmicutes bacterium]|nr:helix-turn-helix transcriptional regulator [Bacillota bacterium]